MDFDVNLFGAYGDGLHDDTKALQQAIDICHENNGGRVLLPGGKTYISKEIVLKSNVELHIEMGAVLKASTYFAEYFESLQNSRDELIMEETFLREEIPFHALIYAKDEKSICISGMGTIDSNESMYYDTVTRYHIQGKAYPRVPMLLLINVKQLTIKEVTLANCGYWTLHPVGCDDVLIDRIRIKNNLRMANCDGIDPDHCKNVRILGSYMECGDDCIVIKNTKEYAEYGDTENIIISDCTLTATSAAIKVGTEGVNDFRNILIENCCISKSNRGVSLQIRDKGNVDNFICNNLTIGTRHFSEQWWGTAEPICITTINRNKDTKAGRIKGVTITNVHCEGENGIFIYGGEKDQIQNVRLSNISITLKRISKWPILGNDIRPCDGEGRMKKKIAGVYCDYVKNIKIQDINVEVEESFSEYFGQKLEYGVEVKNYNKN